jgi:4-hydroxy-2-oxovalerate aldolase
LQPASWDGLCSVLVTEAPAAKRKLDLLDGTPLRLLETTLRDGSYAIDFQFTASDTSIICHELEEAGFEMIELGHGVGLGATELGKEPAIETDEGYMRAAAETLKRSSWGMFCIPGIANLGHLDLAAEYGMDFVRIGTDAKDAHAAEPFVERAKSHGMLVAANFLKSYALPPNELAQKAKLAESFGVDIVYVVDSAGGMMTAEIDDYFAAIRNVSAIPIGFHGHDNLGLSVANALRAVELDALIVDTSLQGLGRSAGNTPTEVFLMVLERHGQGLGIDPLLVMDIGEKYVKPLVDRVGYDSVDVVTGYAQFHTSYMALIREFSGKYRIDPRRLIITLCEHDKVNAPRDLVERLAKQLAEEEPDVFTARFRLDRYHGSEQDPER